MVGTTHSQTLNRPAWGGPSSDIDQHIEIYTHEVDKRFNVESIFNGMTPKRSISGTNSVKFDRMGTSAVKGRRSGEAIDASVVRTDKIAISIDTMLYIRTPIDYTDKWTGPDYLADYQYNHGISFAIDYDRAHMLQLIKARDWVAPVHLKPALNDGIEVQVTLKDNATTQADLEANAILVNLAHRTCVDTLIRRRVPLTNLVTFVNTDIYSTLIEHPKLMNIDFGASNADGFKQRRVVVMNGLPIVEFQEFPNKEDIGTELALGPAYKITAEDAAVEMVTFDRQLALLTVEAQPFTTDFWDHKEAMTYILDCYTMINVGVRRPDVIASVSVTRV